METMLGLGKDDTDTHIISIRLYFKYIIKVG